MIQKATNKPAAVYLRRSTNKQDRSIGDQEAEVQRYAQENRYTIVDSFTDDAVSGTSSTGRHGFQRLMREALGENPRFNYLLVYDMSRFSREDPFEAISQINQLRKNGVEIVSATQNLPKDDSLFLYLPFLQLQAHGDSKKTSLDTIRGQVARARDGFWLGGPPPYGYDLEYVDRDRKPYLRIRFLDSGDRHLLDGHGEFQRILHKGEKLSRSNEDRTRLILGDQRHVAVVQRIFGLYAAGFGYKAIAETLNSEGIPSPGSSRYSKSARQGWSRSTIKSIIDNPVYVGTSIWNRRTSAKLHSFVGGKAKARRSSAKEKFEWNDEADHVVLTGAYTPIVDPELQKRCLELQSRRRRNGTANPRISGRGKASRYLLSGKIQCGHCHHTFIGQTVNKGKRRNDGSRVQTCYYQCGGYTAKGKAICTKAPIPKELIEKVVLKAIRSNVRNFMGAGGDALLRAVLRKALRPQKKSDTREVYRCRNRIVEIEATIDRLLDNLSEDTKEFIDRKVSELKKERDHLAARLEDHQRGENANIDVGGLAKTIVELIREFDAVFATGTVEEQKEFIGLFVEGIEVDPKKRKAQVKIRRFPAPASLDAENLSFRVVAGVRYGSRFQNRPPVDVVVLELVARGSALVPKAA